MEACFASFFANVGLAAIKCHFVWGGAGCSFHSSVSFLKLGHIELGSTSETPAYERIIQHVVGGPIAIKSDMC